MQRTIIVASLAGLAAGALLMAFLQPRSETHLTEPVNAEPHARESSAGVQPEASDASRTIAQVESAPSTAASRASVAPEEDLFSAALLRHFDAQFRSKWMAKRNEAPSDAEVAEGIAEVQRNVLLLAGAIATQMAEAKTKSEAARNALADGDVSGVLKGLKDGGLAVPWKNVTDDFVGRFVARRGSGRSISGAELQKAPKLEDGLSVRFAAGVFAIDASALWTRGGSSALSDVEISGAGMNATLLEIGDISPPGDVRRLSFRDVTLFTGDEGLFDQRSGTLSLDFDSVRVCGFDAGHGGAYLFDGYEGSFIRMSRCEVLGGFGRSPSHGRVFREGPVVALFEDCRFERLPLQNISVGDSSRVLFRGCTLARMPDPTAVGQSGVRFSDCRVEEEWTPQQMRDYATKRPLSELFPEVQNR